MRDSRILATRSLCNGDRGSRRPPPRTFVSGSGIDYYGAGRHQPVTERRPAGSDFLAHLCVDWEQEARAPRPPARGVALLRTGIVLERSGGALPEMMRPFRFFAGGPLGSGSQYMSWVHRLDWVEMVRWIVQTPAVAGPVNVDRAASGDQPPVRARARPRDAPPEPPARAGLRAEDSSLGELAEYRLAGQRVLPALRASARLSLPLPGDRHRVQGIFGD